MQYRVSYSVQLERRPRMEFGGVEGFSQTSASRLIAIDLSVSCFGQRKKPEPFDFGRLHFTVDKHRTRLLSGSRTCKLGRCVVRPATNSTVCPFPLWAVPSAAIVRRQTERAPAWCTSLQRRNRGEFSYRQLIEPSDQLRLLKGSVAV